MLVYEGKYPCPFEIYQFYFQQRQVHLVKNSFANPKKIIFDQ